MTTFGEFIDRILSDWLYPPDDQPTIMQLNANMNDSQTILDYDPSTLIAEEEELLGPGSLIEIGLEQMRVGTVDALSNQITSLIRAVNGTKKASHSVGDIIYIKPEYGRKTLFDAAGSSIVHLYPRVYRRRVIEITTTDGYTEVPKDVDLPESFVWLDGNHPLGTRMKVINIQASSTNKGLITLDVPVGTTGEFTYRAHFPKPTAESQDLVNDLGVLPEFEDAVMVRTIAHIVSTRDLDAMTSDYLTQQLETQNVTVGTGTSIRQALLRYYEYLMDQLSRDVEVIQYFNGYTTGRSA